MSTALSRIDGDLDTMTLGKMLAHSGYFQDARDASQAIVKVLAGRELGIPSIAAMTGIYIVKGRVTLSANLIGAVIKRSGRYNYRVLRMENDGCTIEFYEHGEAIGQSTFTAQDATAAGLSGGNWKAYPRNMMFARAMSNGAKWFCPDVLAGPIYTPDELGEKVDGETGEPIDVTPSPLLTVVESPTDELFNQPQAPDPRESLRNELRQLRQELGAAGGRPSALRSSQVMAMTVQELQEEISLTRDEIKVAMTAKQSQPELAAA